MTNVPSPNALYLKVCRFISIHRPTYLAFHILQPNGFFPSYLNPLVSCQNKFWIGGILQVSDFMAVLLYHAEQEITKTFNKYHTASIESYRIYSTISPFRSFSYCLTWPFMNEYLTYFIVISLTNGYKGIWHNEYLYFILGQSGLIKFV